MQFGILISAAPDSAAALTALSTTNALLAHPEHQLYRLFFYRDGVLLADRYAAASDPAHPCARWQALIAEQQPLATVCIGAALRRGLFDQQQAERHQLPTGNLADGFQLSGLGDWVDTLNQSQRILQFG